MPSSSYHESKDIRNVRTDVAVLHFSDRIFVTISQMAKFGTIISAKADSSEPGSAPTFDISILLGRRDDPLLSIYARQLIEAISKTSARPLLLSIALKERDPDTFREVMEWVLPLLAGSA